MKFRNKFFLKNSNNNQRGAGLLEVLLAVAVFAIGVGTIAHLYLGSHYASMHSVEKNQALIWAKEGLEAMRSIRDGGIKVFTEIVSYGGVTISKETGEFSGYAWSDNIGWIDFSPEGPYPEEPNHSVKLNIETGEVTGWAKALSNNEWIHFYDTEIIDNNFYGWAWGDEILGWISFNCNNQSECAKSDYKVKIPIEIEEEDYYYTEGWAWSDNIGWINFPSILDAPRRGIIIRDDKWMFIGTTNKMEKFTRGIKIEEEKDGVWKMTVTVSWQPPKGDEDNVVLSEYLTKWREPIYLLNVNVGAGGTVATPVETQTAHDYDTVVGIAAEANEGYAFDGWTGDIESIDNPASASTTITMLDGYSITANFREKVETVTVFATVGNHVWEVPEGVTEVDVLVVAGGGGGGASSGSSAGGGGGGAGGLVFEESYDVSEESSISITIGAGGNAGGVGLDNDGQSGGNSVFGILTATGGGGGGARTNNGLSGGSGGGAGSKIATGGSGTTSQGNDGGDSTADASGANPGAGGGGASTAGGTVGSLGAGGDGGEGEYYGDIFGDEYGDSGYFAGGGGGGDGGAGGGGGGGSGGGGDGGSNSDGQNSPTNTGGGGGGAATSNHNAGNGGSGIVLIRYLQ